MAVALSISAVVFAALCVWLTVRMINRRERWAKWTLAAVVSVPVLYLLGFGIACRATSVPLGGSIGTPPQILEIYSPIGALAADRNTKAASVIRWYMRLWTPDQGCVLLPTARGKFAAIFPHPPARPARPVKPSATTPDAPSESN